MNRCGRRYPPNAKLDGEIQAAAKDDETARRLQTIPGIGPITATALAASMGDRPVLRTPHHHRSPVSPIRPLNQHARAVRRSRPPMSPRTSRNSASPASFGVPSSFSESAAISYSGTLPSRRARRSTRRIRTGDLCARSVAAPKKTFKDYEPGFLHIDIKYLPQMSDETQRRYLFVAIDSTTTTSLNAL